MEPKSKQNAKQIAAQAQPRIWQRGASKGRKNSTNARQMQASEGFQADPMMSALQRSLIAETIQGARASMHEPSRPFTPGDLPRHLFQGDDYSNRPGSSYKVSGAATQAATEFQKSHTSFKSTKTESKTTLQSTAHKQSESVVNIMNKTNLAARKGFSPLPVIGKPVKFPMPQKPLDEDLSKIDMSEESKLQAARNFDTQKEKNARMMQELTDQLRESNNNQVDEEDYGDELEDQMESQLMLEADEMGILNGDAVERDIYSEALERVQQVMQIDTRGQVWQDDQDEMDQYADDLMNNLEMEQQQSGYSREFEDVISTISEVCRVISQQAKRGEGHGVDTQLVIELVPRIWSLAIEHKTITEEDKQKWFLETLLKGSFSMLAIKSPPVAIKISACNIEVFLQIFQKKEQFGDFRKVFDYCYETVRGLLIYAKEGKFDVIFVEEGIQTQIAILLKVCFIENQDKLNQLLAMNVAGKQIQADDRVLDLLNYSIGTLKCFTQTNKLVQEETIQARLIPVMSLCAEKLFRMPISATRKAMILVQITGVLRNLANVDSSHPEISRTFVKKMCDIFFDSNLNTGKELILNIARLLSKVSLDPACADQMVQSGHLTKFMKSMVTAHKDSSAILIRIAYILGNLTTNFDRARLQLNHKDAHSLQHMIELSTYYLHRDRNPDSYKPTKGKSKYEEFTQGNLEDAITKIIKLIANLSTDEQAASRDLPQLTHLLEPFFQTLMAAVASRSLEKHEEFILNAISCTTNILFYDNPSVSIITDKTRIQLFQTLKQFLLATQNEEIQIESVRVISNLSRHSSICDYFLNDAPFLRTICCVLDHNLRDLVFYSVGIVINISLHGKGDQTATQLLGIQDSNVLEKLVEVLKDSNLEDMDLARVAAKALHNLQKIPDAHKYWNESLVERLDELTRSLGDDLDGIMEVATEEELVEITQLRNLLNALVNDMPELTKDCPLPSCGRKFKQQADLDNHLSRRHPEYKQ